MTKPRNHVKYHTEIYQGSDEWHEIRRGILTASEMKLIITPAKLQYASNDKERTHLYELVAQRISKYVEPSYVGEDMMRGTDDEFYARQIYSEKIAPVKEVGFITNDSFGFTIGYSPDGLIGDDGLIEIKSRKQKYQVETIISGEMPADFLIQVQTGLLVSERKWCDFISYHGGLPMFPKRVHADKAVQDAIANAATIFEAKISEKIIAYRERLANIENRLIPTERRMEQEISVW